MASEMGGKPRRGSLEAKGSSASRRKERATGLNTVDQSNNMRTENSLQLLDNHGTLGNPIPCKHSLF